MVLSVAWQTASESNSSHFVVQASVNGDTWTELGRVASKADRSSSSAVLSYSFSYPVGGLAVAGFGLLGLLLLPASRNRMVRLCVWVLLLGALVSCAKVDEADVVLDARLKSAAVAYVRLAQVDLDGTVSYSQPLVVKQ